MCWVALPRTGDWCSLIQNLILWSGIIDRKMPEEKTMLETAGDHTPIIIAKDVVKWYGHFQALKGVSMEVDKGEVVVIFGPSGSGKSTFIRCINHLEDHQGGQIIVDGIELINDM